VDKLSETTAVRVARAALAAYDSGGDNRHPSSETAYWGGRIREALRLVLAAIDDAEGDTP
jgi:hypothetical protein